MCKIFIISLLSLFINSFATAQSVVPSVIMGRDTVPHVLLHEVDVVARLKNPRKYAHLPAINPVLGAKITTL